MSAAPDDPRFLRQVHGQQLIWRSASRPQLWAADAQWTGQAGLVLGVQVADCLPLLLCDEGGQFVMAVHAGWRGVLAGIVHRAVVELRARIAAGMRILVWIGPGIGACHFQVGAELRQQFIARNRANEAAFLKVQGHWHADLPALVQAQLQELSGVVTSADGRCTFCHPELFYSFRRDGSCGRMAAMIWRDP